jgi:hypothetical protein
MEPPTYAGEPIPPASIKKTKGICLGILALTNHIEKDNFTFNIRKWIKENGKPSIIVSGGETCVRDYVADFASKNKIPLDEICPDHFTYGKNTDYIRNEQITTLCSHLLVFSKSNSKNISNLMKKAKDKNKKINLVLVTNF